MVRVKRGTTANKRRKNVLKHTKGFLFGRKSKYRLAKDAVLHSLLHSYKDRKRKKREFRQMWQVQINSSVRKHGLSYSKFINLLKKNKIELDRKVLSILGDKHPDIFEKIVEQVKKPLK